MGLLKKRKNIFNFFGDILSLSEKYRPFIFIIILSILAIIPINTLQSLPNLSICNAVLGDLCYSVGITRGVSSILKGDLSLALSFNPLSFLVLALMIFILLIDIKNIIASKTITI